MTTAQRRRLYFPAWNAAAKVHGWKPSLKGMALLATRQAAWGGPEVDKLYGKLWFIALGLADLEDREFCADHLRHACNLAATGGKKRHSEDLNNKETNRVVALLELLANPINLHAMNAWLHPDAAAREGVLIQIRKLAPLAYIISISRGKFSRDDWESLPDAELSQLLYTLKARARSRAEARPAVGGAASSGAALSEPQPVDHLGDRCAAQGVRRRTG